MVNFKYAFFWNLLIVAVEQIPRQTDCVHKMPLLKHWKRFTTIKINNNN